MSFARPYNPSPSPSPERTPLLAQTEPYPGPLSPSPYDDQQHKKLNINSSQHVKRRAFAACGVVILFAVAIAVALATWETSLSDDPLQAAYQILARSPIIDGHIDLPILVREEYANNISAFNLNEQMPGHVDIPRLRQGRVGAFFWSVYVDCKPDNEVFTRPTYRVRDTLEQIDVARLLISQYPKVFYPAFTAADIKEAQRKGRIASLIGVEGGHQLGNSLSVLRMYHALGARYVTLTHSCNNAFADSGGMVTPPPPVHHGLSKLGESLVYEMNRLGMLVDISHVSDETAEQALQLSASRGAPVFWSHSSVRAIRNISRNVPDELLEKLTLEDDGMARWRGQTDGVVMINFAPQFIANEGEVADVRRVADHVEHVGRVAGREHVGIGSDFDGIGSVPRGLEDVSKYPDLIAELYARGWTPQELAGLSGGNLIRVLERAGRASARMIREGASPAMDIYEYRDDLPIRRDEL